jgi:hypothetical protein
MSLVVQLDSYRPGKRNRGANTRLITEMASKMCETAFLEKDWERFDYYFRILKSARGQGERISHVSI